MTERLTWSKIIEKYPYQWVGLIDIEYLSPDDETNIKSAIVVIASDDKFTVQKTIFSLHCGGTWNFTNPESLPMMFAVNW